MKKVKIDEKSKFMYVRILSVLILALSFLFGFKKLESNADRLKAENGALTARIADLQQYYDTEAQNLKDTEDMTASIKDIFSGYAGYAGYEDAVYEAFNLYSASNQSLEFDSISFDKAVSVKEIPVETVQAAGIEGLENEIDFYRFDVVYSGKVLYEGLKGMAREISDSDYNLAVGSMNYMVNANGYLEGKTMTSFYFVDGAGCTYSAPPVAKYETGLANLFGVSGKVMPEDK